MRQVARLTIPAVRTASRAARSTRDSSMWRRPSLPLCGFRQRPGRSERAEPLARFGARELSLVDPMKPPRSFITGNGNGSEGTLDRLGLSSGPERSV